MSQSNYRPTLAIKLASMQPPEAPDSSALAGFAANSAEVAIANNLLLYPGEPGEMLVQLENLGTHSLRWRLEVEGDFPLNWCLWQQKKLRKLLLIKKWIKPSVSKFQRIILKISML